MRLRLSRAGSGLPTADRDYVIARAHQPVSCLVHITQVPRTERQRHVLLLAFLQVNSSESAQCAQRSSRLLGKSDVELDHFVSVALSRVPNIHIDIQRIPG